MAEQRHTGNPGNFAEDREKALGAGCTRRVRVAAGLGLHLVQDVRVEGDWQPVGPQRLVDPGADGTMIRTVRDG